MTPSNSAIPVKTVRLAADRTGIDRAAGLLRDGRLVAFPTETVYGLGGDGTDDRAVAGIFDAKGRPRFNPLILHVTSFNAAAAIVEIPPLARRVAENFWPGPLTLILPRRRDAVVSRLATAGLDTVAVRVPSHPVAARLLALLDRPIAAPSANRSGRLSPTAAEHVLDGLDGRISAVLDGGFCPVGVESTVIDLTVDPPLLLRPGGLDPAWLAGLVGPLRQTTAAEDVAVDDDGAAPRSPGRLLRHYAPATPIRLDADRLHPGEALLAFGEPLLAGAGPSSMVRNLSPVGDPTEAAANLFRMLHELDALRPTAIAVMPIADSGLGLAINDRLRRAAAAQRDKVQSDTAGADQVA